MGFLLGFRHNFGGGDFRPLLLIILIIDVVIKIRRMDAVTKCIVQEREVGLLGK